jgi:hypothetical protein
VRLVVDGGAVRQWWRRLDRRRHADGGQGQRGQSGAGKMRRERTEVTRKDCGSQVARKEEAVGAAR